MFSSCKSLKETPLLPAEQLAADCYHGMFSGCSSLYEVWIKAKPSFSGNDEEEILNHEVEYSQQYFYRWLEYAAGGTIYCTEEFNNANQDLSAKALEDVLFSSSWRTLF